MTNSTCFIPYLIVETPSSYVKAVSIYKKMRRLAYIPYKESYLCLQVLPRLSYIVLTLSERLAKVFNRHVLPHLFSPTTTILYLPANSSGVVNGLGDDGAVKGTLR